MTGVSLPLRPAAARSHAQFVPRPAAALGGSRSVCGRAIGRCDHRTRRDAAVARTARDRSWRSAWGRSDSAGTCPARSRDTDSGRPPPPAWVGRRRSCVPGCTRGDGGERGVRPATRERAPGRRAPACRHPPSLAVEPDGRRGAAAARQALQWLASRRDAWRVQRDVAGRVRDRTSSSPTRCRGDRRWHGASRAWHVDGCGAGERGSLRHSRRLGAPGHAERRLGQGSRRDSA